MRMRSSRRMRRMEERFRWDQEDVWTHPLLNRLKCTRAHTHTHTCTHTHAYTHTHVHARTHARTHAHTPGLPLLHMHETQQLTDQRNDLSEVVGHDEEVHTLQATTGLQVAKRVGELTFLPTMGNVHLRGGRERERGGEEI